MEFKNLPIKETESLIAILCYLMYSKEAEHLEVQQEVCKELERRGTITSWETLYKYIM